MCGNGTDERCTPKRAGRILEAANLGSGPELRAPGCMPVVAQHHNPIVLDVRVARKRHASAQTRGVI